MPHYTICTHDVPDDRVVSGSFHHGASYEREESKLLIRMANYSAGKQSPSSSAVAVIDGGAHLGTHTLTLARFGYQVWAVDPLPMNTVKVISASRKSNQGLLNTKCLVCPFQLYHSLGLSGIGYNNVHLIQNTLDWTRNATTLAIERANVGGTIIVPEKRRGATHVEAQSVLLSDVIHDILGHPQYENKKTVTLIMKLDIESYECRTIIGSRQIFDHPRLYIPYIVMEWRYCAKLFPGTNKCDFPPSCPDELLKNMTMLLVSKHYDPTSSKGLPLNPENSLLWRPMNVVWQHKSARRVLP